MTKREKHKRDLEKAEKAARKAAIDNLNGALDVLKTYGWRQGEFGAKESGFCLLGALSTANGPGAFVADEAVHKVLSKQLQFRGGVASYNDHSGRKLSEIKKLISKTKSGLRDGSVKIPRRYLERFLPE